jgi:ABC-type Fe3+-siderophore transport system permease subunit
MNNEFQIAQKTEGKLLTRILTFFFISVLSAIFKNRNNFRLSMLTVINAIFFGLFHIFTLQRKIRNTLTFPNYFKLNIGLCFYDMICCFCICLFDSFGLSHDLVYDPMNNVYFIACFISMILNAVLIYLFFRYNKVKKRLIQLQERLEHNDDA